MVTWNENQLKLHEMKREPKQSALIPTDGEREEALHYEIIAWCKRQWPQVPYIHNRMDRKSTATKGSPDFILLLPAGRTLFVECKTERGRKAP